MFSRAILRSGLTSRSSFQPTHKGSALLSTKATSLHDSYENILVSQHLQADKVQGLSVGLIILNRPKTLNALSDALFDDLIHAAQALDQDEEIGSIVITGKGKAFAAGADIEEMSQKQFSQAYKSNMFSQWAKISKLSKPLLAAVNGFALGGGCELAMMCDIIIASSNAKFGQPEINLGVIPGAGGTQRLVRAIGKSKAMEMVLTGNMIDAEKAESDGLISKVVMEREELVQEAIKMGHVIGQKGQVSVQMAKEAVNAADEMNLEQGLQFERRLFHSLFATKDQKEGMTAFLNKRQADFTHE